MKYDSKILWISVLVGATTWVVDASIDAFLFTQKPFLASLLYDDLQDIFGRVVTLAIVFIFGVLMARTVASRKAAESELEKANKELEMKVEERTSKLRQTNDQLEAELNERRKMEEALQESEKRLRNVSLQLLTVQEIKRREICRELHDEFGQTLAVLKQRLWRVQKRVGAEASASELVEDVNESLQRVDEIIENVRRISRDLSPHILEHGGLSTALRKLISDFSKHYNVDVTTELDSLDHKIPKASHIIIYRIFQEALNNIGKHAFASHLSIFVKHDGDGVSFAIEDNGQGFDVNHTILRKAAGKGLGLAILDERVKMLAGRIEHWSQEGKGTRVSFSIHVSTTRTD